MILTAQIYRIIEANRSLDKLISQDLEYPIRTAYNLIKIKRELDNSIDYVMERFGIVCGNKVDFENISDEQNVILNSILSQVIEIELPEIDIEDIISVDNVMVKPSDIENITFLFKKKA
jgi:hypothetical protein